MKREDVYRLIDGERAYQQDRWRHGGQPEHSPEEWFTYIADYVQEAQHLLSRNTYDTSKDKAMDIMRKVGAMAVAAMEEHETPDRPNYSRTDSNGHVVVEER